MLERAARKETLLNQVELAAADMRALPFSDVEAKRFLLQPPPAGLDSSGVASAVAGIRLGRVGLDDP